MKLSIFRNRRIRVPEFAYLSLVCGSACTTDHSASPRCSVVGTSNDSGRSAGGILVVANAAPVASSMNVTSTFRLNHPIAKLSLA